MDSAGSKPAFADTQPEQDRRALHSMLEYLRETTRADRCVAILKPNSSSPLSVTAGQPLAGNADPLVPLRNECLAMGKLVDCEDVSSDKRLNADLCRRSWIAAVVIAPVMLDGRTMGAVEMHSSQLHNFMQHELEVLQRVADAIGALICLK